VVVDQVIGKVTGGQERGLTKIMIYAGEYQK
jgi:hypothetical protein